MLKLYYYPTSHWSRIISLQLAELGAEFERVVVEIPNGASFEPDYLRLNPRGVVPTLTDGDNIVCDGRRIAEHLDARTGGNLWRRDDDEVQSWSARLHDVPVMLFSYSIWVLARKGEKSKTILDDKVARARRYADENPDLRAQYLRKAEFFQAFRDRVYDDEHVANQRAACAAVLDEMGRATLQHDWLAATGYSFADCIATSILYRLIDLGIVNHWAQDSAHGLFSYYQRLRARPSFRAVFYDDPMIPEKYRPTEPLPAAP